jgi:tetratricopeptide (TPR) repeat protein
MINNHRAIVACVAAVLIAVPIVAWGESAEDWLRKGKEETNLDLRVDDFTRAIRLNPDLAEAYACRGTANSDLERYDKAIADYTSAIGLSPDNAQTYNNRGYAYEMLGKHDKAIADYTQALRLEPHYAGALNNRGISYYNAGLKEKALADFDKACKYGSGDACKHYYSLK